jgi:hypothetical protein
MNTGGLCGLSTQEFEELCRYLLPSGHKEGYRWLVGSSRGEPGHSFDVNLRTSVFGDWAVDGKMKCGPVALWMTIRNVNFALATRELSDWLGRPVAVHYLGHRQTSIVTPGDIFLPPGLSKPTREDFQALSETRSISHEPLHIATDRGFLGCFDDELNGRCWLYTDQRRRCALRRRLDNKPFRLRNGSQTKSAACKGSDMRTALGCQEALPYPCIGIAEGGPNSLAIIAHAYASGVEERFAPICMPSASANFTPSDLAYLRGKRARIFIDDDKAGQEASQRWAAQLKRAEIITDGFSFAGLVKNNGDRVKDLNDLLEIDYDCWERYRGPVESVSIFAFEKGNRCSQESLSSQT